MRVRVVGINYRPEMTGIAPYTAGIASALKNQGFDVRVTTAMPHYPSWKIDSQYKKWSQTETLDDVHVDRVRHFVPNKPSGVLRIISELSFGLRTIKSVRSADTFILVSPALFSSFVFLLAAKCLKPRVTTITWVQDLYAMGIKQIQEKTGLTYRVLLKIERFLFRTSDQVVTIHEGMASSIRDNYNIEAEKINVIRNWPHLDTTIRWQANELRGELGWSGKKVVLHTGNMGEKQGLENVIEAAKLCEETHPELLFVLVGDGSKKKDLQKLASELVNVQFLDPFSDEDYFSVLRAADVLLVNEVKNMLDTAFPSKLTSYFLAEKPILAATNNSSGTSQELRANNVGLVTEPENPKSLLATLVELLADEKKMGELGANAHKYVLERFSLNQAVELMIHVLEKAKRSKPRR